MSFSASLLWSWIDLRSLLQLDIDQRVTLLTPGLCVFWWWTLEFCSFMLFGNT